jgi:hypothetical protein
MELQGRELSAGMQGSEVGLLHTELALIGIEVSADERTASVYGPGTEQAVAEFQRGNNLPASGVVDKRTAALINRAVDARPDRSQFTVTGTVRFENGRPVAGARVVAEDVDLRAAEPLGETATDARGHYEVKYHARQFVRAEKGAADLRVTVRDDRGGTTVSPIRFNASVTETIDLVVAGAPRQSEYELLVAELKPLVGDLALADLTEDDTHQDVTFLTGETGRDVELVTFLILAHRLARRVDIRADAFYGLLREGLPATLEAIVDKGPLQQRAALEAAVRDAIVPDSLRGDIDAVLKRLAEAAAAVPLDRPATTGSASLRELLGAALPSDDAKVAFLRTAAAHEEPQKFWAAARQDPSLRDRADALQITLQLGGLTNNHLPLMRQLETIAHGAAGVAELAKLSDEDWEALIAAPGVGVPADFPVKGDAARVAYARRLARTVEDAYPAATIAHRVAGDAAVPNREAVAAFFSSNDTFDPRTTRLDTYVAAHPQALDAVPESERPLVADTVKSIQRLYRVAPEYRQVSALMAGGLHSACSMTRMSETMFALRFAESVGGSGEAVRLYERARQQSAAATIMMAEYAMGTSGVTTAVVSDVTTEVPVDGVPDWRGLFGSVDLCGCEHCRSVYSPAAYLTDVLHFLRDRELVNSISRDAQGHITGVTFQTVPKPGGGTRHKTAKDVLFARRPDIGEIELTCDNTNIPLPYVDLVNEVLEDYVAPPPAFAPFTLAATLESDLAARTVSAALTAGFTPPLTPHASITVAKAATRWTIDDLSYSYTIRKDGTNLRVTARGRQSRGTAEELAANPQYTNAEAYARLRTRVFPWALPYDLWASEASVYLGHLDSSRHALMESLLPGDRATRLDDLAGARAHLGLTTMDAELATGVTTSQAGAATPGPWNLWGFSTATVDAAHPVADPADGTTWITSGAWLAVLASRVDVFLQQSGLEYKQLLALLSTELANPGGAITMQSIEPAEQDTCDLARLRLAGLTEPLALKISRIVRFWRKSGWSFYDLDRAARAFGVTDITDAFTRRVSQAARVANHLNQPPERVLPLWASIEAREYIDHERGRTTPTASLYALLFRNRAVVNPPDAAFTEDPAALSGTLTDRSATIGAALGISSDDVMRLIGDALVIPRQMVDPAQPDDRLTLDYLSRLYRHATLARRIKLSVADYLSVLALSAADPVATPVASLLFAELVDAIRSSGFTIAQLEYLLRHTSSASSRAALTDDQAAVILSGLRDAIQAIVADNTFHASATPAAAATVDLRGDLTREKLALLNWEAAVIDRTVAILNGTWTFEAPLAALNAAIAIPPAFAERLVYDGPAATLRFTGTLSAAERTTLLGLAGVDAPFTAAVNALFEAPRHFVRRSMRSFSVADHAVPLAALPASVVLPSPAAPRMYYDSAAHQLHARGALLESERDALLGLSTNAADPQHGAYVAAVAAVFALPDTFVPVAGDAYLTADGVGNDAAVLFDTLAAPGDRFAHVLVRLMPWLANTLSRRAVVQQLAETFQLETRVAEPLLTARLTSPTVPARALIEDFVDPAFAQSAAAVPVTPAGFAAAFAALTRFHKVSLVASTLAFGTTELSWLFAAAAAAAWPDLNQLPVTAATVAAGTLLRWQRLWELAALRNRLPLGAALVDELFTLATLPGGATNAQKDAAKTAWSERLATLTGWSDTDLAVLTGSKTNHADTGLLGLAFPDAYADERMLARLVRAFADLRQVGLSATVCQSLVTADVTEAVARDIRQAVRARYEADQWLTLAKPLRDTLREQQRSALVSYLVAMPGTTNAWRDVNDVYGHFLIDVEMSPCQIASRISLAINATQLFAQRCLMRLEAGVLASAEVDSKWDEWSWMKNYRVWEANRKVFLYPENWIEPELRDDKTPFFEELEGDLLQDDVNVDTAEQAFRAYLEKLDRVARLEIVGEYHEQEQDVVGNMTKDVLHVFGRTYGSPHVYYYRYRDDTVWSAWERVDLDIEADQLMPVVWNRRLYLFWLQFIEKGEAGDPKMPATNNTLPQPAKVFEIKLAWSNYKNGAWAPKTSSIDSYTDNQLELDWLATKDVYSCKAFVSDGDLTVRVFRYTLARYQWPWFEFRFAGCRALPTVHELGQGMGDLPPVVQPEGTKMRANEFVESTVFESAGGKLVLFTGNFPATGEPEPEFDAARKSIPTLKVTPGTFRVLPPHQDAQFVSQRPFFFQDASKTFLVEPSDHSVTTLSTTPDRVHPGVIDLIPEIYYEVNSKFPFDPIGPVINPLDGIGPVVYPGDRPGGRGAAPVVTTFPLARSIAAAEVRTEGIERSFGGATMAARVMRTVGGAAGPTAAAAPGGLALSSGLPGISLGFGSGFGSVLGPMLDRLMTVTAAPASMNGTMRFLSGAGPTAGAFVSLIDAKTALKRDIVYGYTKATKKEKRYRFRTFYHPFVCAFMRQLNQDGVDGLLQRQLQLSPAAFMSPPTSFSFLNRYKPHELPKQVVIEPYPVEDVDFEYDGAYSVYNWELFFHAPLLIAVSLSRNQRFEDAQQWFHYIFDPTDASGHPAPQRYWRTKPFFETTADEYYNESIPNLLRFLANRGDAAAYGALTPAQRQRLETLEAQVRAWREDPFKPHLVARLRTTAYQKTVLMKYLDNLIGWGDQLYRRDTMESISEATQLYVLAAELLGKRPPKIPPRAVPTIETYNSIEPKLDSFSNALVQIEEFVPPSVAATPPSGGEPPVTLPTMLYFCVPKNDRLLAYWDTVADRLFKIRHCMNIEGVVRPLSLFAPPIDPALLVRAAAAGIDLSSALNDVSAASPHYRFNLLSAKATEICQQLIALGGAMLSALEKRDAEDLGLLRARHETALTRLIEDVRKGQLAEATEALAALRRSRDTAVTKYIHYQRLLGLAPTAPAEGQAIQEIPSPANAAITDSAGVKMIGHESSELSDMSDADSQQSTAAGFQVAASIASLFPNFNIQPWGVGATWGGSNVGSGLSAFGSYFQALSQDATFAAQRAARVAALVMRENDAVLQANQAAREIMQIDKQIVAATIRKEVADVELRNQQTQSAQAREVQDFLEGKYTGRQLFNWMVGQIASTYFQAYQLAYDVAKRAERSFRRELGLLDSSYIRFGYWDSLRKGLLAGERLMLDIKRMEVAYLEQNRREYEITKHLSLAQLDPLALVQLRQTGSCFVRVPEVVFDLDHPGHYMRRIKSVALTIPCVTGPYVGVPCTLRLLSSEVRYSPSLSGGQYARQDDDARFRYSVGNAQAVVASSAQNDSGLFEPSLQDDRYLPFEGEGTTASYSLSLPATFRPFDYDTITDVVLHVRYTSRDGGEPLRQRVLAEIEDAINGMAGTGNQTGAGRIFSARHEFSSEWQRFLTPAAAGGDQTLTLALSPDRFPYVFREAGLTMERLRVLVKINPAFAATHNASTVKLSLATGAAASASPLPVSTWNGLLLAERVAGTSPGQWTLTAWLDTGTGTHQRLDPAAVEEVFVLSQCSV